MSTCSESFLFSGIGTEKKHSTGLRVTMNAMLKNQRVAGLRKTGQLGCRSSGRVFYAPLSQPLLSMLGGLESTEAVLVSVCYLVEEETRPFPSFCSAFVAGDLFFSLLLEICGNIHQPLPPHVRPLYFQARLPSADRFFAFFVKAHDVLSTLPPPRCLCCVQISSYLFVFTLVTSSIRPLLFLPAYVHLAGYVARPIYLFIYLSNYLAASIHLPRPVCLPTHAYVGQSISSAILSASRHPAPLSLIALGLSSFLSEPLRRHAHVSVSLCVSKSRSRRTWVPACLEVPGPCRYQGLLSL